MTKCHGTSAARALTPAAPNWLLTLICSTQVASTLDNHSLHQASCSLQQQTGPCQPAHLCQPRCEAVAVAAVMCRALDGCLCAAAAQVLTQLHRLIVRGPGTGGNCSLDYFMAAMQGRCAASKVRQLLPSCDWQKNSESGQIAPPAHTPSACLPGRQGAPGCSRL